MLPSPVNRMVGASAIPEALALLVRAYKPLQLEDLAADAMRVLEPNYPSQPGVAEVKKVAV